MCKAPLLFCKGFFLLSIVFYVAKTCMYCACRNMAGLVPRTLCMRCLHVQNKKAPCDPEGECNQCKEKLAVNGSIMSDTYYKCAIRNAIFTEVLRRRNNAYVAHSIGKAIVSHIPLSFMLRFIKEVAEKGRLERARPWDKEGPRVLAKNFKDAKSWFFTTFGAVSHLASFEELDAVIREDEVAFGLLRQPGKKGDCFLLLPPCEVSWDSREVARNVELTAVTITTCTGNIACLPHAVLSVSPVHPHDFTNCKRWPHLPFYNDWQLYIRWKAKFFLRRNQEHLECGDVLVAATKELTWEASDPLVVVPTRVPGADFKVKPDCFLPYQNPKLTSSIAGVETLRDRGQ